MQGKKQYTKKLFMQFHLSDYVPQENFYPCLAGVPRSLAVVVFCNQQQKRSHECNTYPMPLPVTTPAMA